jgi:esterase/lipase
MEREIKIKTPDKKLIVGTLGISSKKSNKLVVFVHGFTGHSNEHQFFNGSKFLTSKGLDTFRFNLYAGEGKKVRHFKDTSISLHGEDIDTVVKFFRKKYKKIFVVGHSYGGTSLLFTNSSLIEGYVFWDASYVTPKDATEDVKLNKHINRYIIDWGIEILAGEKFIEELKNFPDCGKLIKNINKPVLFITAGRLGNSKAGIKYFRFANNPKKLINIKTADHNFNNWKDEEELLKSTYSWLRQF